MFFFLVFFSCPKQLLANYFCLMCFFPRDHTRITLPLDLPEPQMCSQFDITGLTSYNSIISTYNLGLIMHIKKKFSYLPYLVCWFEIKEPCIVTTAKKWLAKDGITKFRHSVTCMTRQPLSRKNNFGKMTVQCSGYI